MIQIRRSKSVKMIGDTDISIFFLALFNTTKQKNLHYKDFLLTLQEARAYHHSKADVWELPEESFIKNNIYSKLSEIDEIEYIDTLNPLEKTLPVKNSKLPRLFKFNYKTKPFIHQREFLYYFFNHRKLLNGCEMGAGKSKCAIDAAVILKEKKIIKKCLIVCCVNGNKYNWADEIKRHSDEESMIVDGSFNKRIEILRNMRKSNETFYIINIESLRLKPYMNGKMRIFPIVMYIRKLVEAGEIGMIVVDEMHKVANPKALQSKALMQIRATYQLAMSGTFVVNKPLDLYNPLVWIGAEKRNYWSFTNNYCVKGGYGGYEIVGYKNIDEITKITNNHMFRKTKDELIDLPEKIYKDVYCEMDNKQKKLYNEVRLALLNEKHKIKASFNPLSKLIRLRQVTGDTNIITKENIITAKLELFTDKLEEILNENKRVVIYSNWTEITNMLRARIKTKFNILGAYVTGERKSDENYNEVKRFQNKQTPVIIGTVGSLGTGFTLDAANYVIFYDEPWSSAYKEQALDRTHRITTKHNITSITLLTKNTIDEKIHKIIENKKAISEEILDKYTKKKEMEVFIENVLSSSA